MARRSPQPGQVTLFDQFKRCSKCRQDKTLDNFTKAPKRKDGLRPWCRDCSNADTRARYRANPAAVLARTTAWARAHPEVNRQQSARWRERNRDLLKARKRAQYNADREQIGSMLRDAAFKRKYGISLMERDAMAAAQGFRCVICGAHEDDLTKRLSVDHDHRTGAVRMLLCEQCNFGLGQFRDSPELLQRAMDYLREHAAAAEEEPVHGA